MGRNTNPNAVEFRAAFKKLLVCHPVLTSVDHNVITNATGILTVSSTSTKRPLPSSSQDQAFDFELECCYEDLILGEIDAMEPYDQHMCAYQASCIEEKVLQSIKLHKYKCTKCADVLSDADDRINDELLAMKAGERIQPSRSTFKLVMYANAVMKMCSVERSQGNELTSILKVICENVDINDLYSNFQKHHEQSESAMNEHKNEFISQVIKVYMTMKSKQICKRIKITNIDHPQSTPQP